MHDHDSNQPRYRAVRNRSGFTLFEVILAMFVVLMGLMGIIATFSVGMRAQVVAQELVVSQELANMWADWVRFRLTDVPGSATPNKLTSANLMVGDCGDFYNNSNSANGSMSPVGFNLGGGNASDLPLFHKQLYLGYTWKISRLVMADGTAAAGPGLYVPQWIPQKCTNLVDAASIPTSPINLQDWTLNLSGGAIYPATLGAAPNGLTQVELTIERYGRKYIFNYTFSGAGLKY